MSLRFSLARFSLAPVSLGLGASMTAALVLGYAEAVLAQERSPSAPFSAASTLPHLSQLSTSSTLSASAASGNPRLRQGNQVVLNGIRRRLPWIQRLDVTLAKGGQAAQGTAAEAIAQQAAPGIPPGTGSILVSDVALRSLGGIDFLDSNNPYQQPILWRSNPLQDKGTRLVLPAQLTAQQRYLDITPLIDQARWLVRLEGESLTIQTPALQAANLALPLAPTFAPQTIQWSPYLTWRQSYERLGGAQFPVTQLQVRLEPGVVALRPIWPQSPNLVGIERLAQTVESHRATAAINGGFFNRNNRTPLGAIRSEGEWISGPILNRGAIAWDGQGRITMDRLALEETLIASGQSQPFSIAALNSGYLKAGFARYTRAWGSSYSPLTDNEVLIYVVEGRVTEQRTTGKAGQGNFPIPPSDRPDSYLLVARSNRTGAARLPVGTLLTLRQQTSPSAIANSPNILGGGPLLLQGGRIVLDAQAEGFSKAFIDERAPRSVAATLADGRFALITVHNRIGGRGPSLAELARLLQSLGAVNALNLDGGSSTQLFLGGEMIDRDPRTAARVHNGLGVFQDLPGQLPAQP